MDETGKLIGVIGDEVVCNSCSVVPGELTQSKLIVKDTVTGFVLAGVGHRNAEGSNFLVVKAGKFDVAGGKTSFLIRLKCRHGYISS
jgi:hypothetical protein